MKAVGVKVWVVLATTRLVRQARQQGLGSGAPCSTLLRAPGLCAPLVSPLPVSPLPVTAACHHCLCHHRLSPPPVPQPSDSAQKRLSPPGLR